MECLTELENNLSHQRKTLKKLQMQFDLVEDDTEEFYLLKNLTQRVRREIRVESQRLQSIKRGLKI